MNFFQILQLSAGILNPAVDSTILETDMLNEVVVTANREEKKAFFVPASISSVNQKHINKHLSRTTPEILFGMAGVFVQKTNHGGGSPFVRGLTGNQTLLLIDGIRLNNSTFRYGPNQYFNTIDPFSISRIEVLKGDGSVQYGSDAMGGTIQVFTENPEFKSGLHGYASGRLASSKIEQSGRVSLSYGTDKVALMANFGKRNFGDLPGGKNTGIQKGSGYDEQMANFKSIFKTKNGELTLAHQYFEATDVPVYHKLVLENYAINQFSTQRRNLSYAKHVQRTENPIFKEISTTASWQQTLEVREIQKNGATNLLKETDHISTKGLNVNVKSAFSKNWTASSGLESYFDLVNSDKLIQYPDSAVKQRGLYPDDSKASSYAFYTLHTYNLNKWSFAAGFRYNAFSLKIKDETLGVSDLNFNAAVPNVSVTYLPIDNYLLYVRYNRGFRAPNVDDMGTLGIVDFRYEIPAYGLKPESADNFELGYKFRSKWLSFSTALFYNKLTNLITRVKLENQVKDAYPVYIKENVESAYLKGFEFDVQGIINAEFKYFGNLTYTYGQNLAKDEPLRRTPPTFGRLGLEYDKSGFFIRPEIQFAGEQKRLASGDISDNRIGPEGTAAWTVLNVYSGFNWRFVSLNMAIQNLGNVDYRLHGSGINSVGRSAVFGLKCSF